MSYEVQRVRKTGKESGMLRHRTTTKRTPLVVHPKTGKEFQMSNHGATEVATGTLKKIKRAAGI